MTTIVHLGEAELAVALDVLGRVARACDGPGLGGLRAKPSIRLLVDQAGRSVMTLAARRRAGPTLHVEEIVSHDHLVPTTADAVRRWIAMLQCRDPAAAAAADGLRMYREALVASLLPQGTERAIVRPGSRIVPPVVSIRRLEGGPLEYEGAARDGGATRRGSIRMGATMAEALTDRDVAHVTAFGPADGPTILVGVAPDIVVHPPSKQDALRILRDLGLRPPGMPQVQSLGA